MPVWFCQAGLRSLGLGSAKEASRSMAVLVKMARQQFSSTPESLFGLSMVRVILQALEDSQGKSMRQLFAGMNENGLTGQHFRLMRPEMPLKFAMRTFLCCSAFGDAFDHLAKASEGVLCSLVQPEHEDSMRTLVESILDPTRASSAARPRSEGLPPPMRRPQNAPTPPPRLMPPASVSNRPLSVQPKPICLR